MKKKVSVSDFFYYLIKQLIFFFIFHVLGFALYAFTVGHIINDEQVAVSTKNFYLVLFSVAMLVGLSYFKYNREKNDVGKKSQLIEASRADDFDLREYYMTGFYSDVLPYTIASSLFILPYSIFYMFFGFGYENSLVIDRFFVASMAGIVMFWGVVGVIIQSAILGGVYALSCYIVQKRILDDRMWLKNAAKQENVELKKSKSNYKNY